MTNKNYLQDGFSQQVRFLICCENLGSHSPTEETPVIPADGSCKSVLTKAKQEPHKSNGVSEHVSVDDSNRVITRGQSRYYKRKHENAPNNTGGHTEAPE